MRTKLLLVVALLVLGTGIVWMRLRSSEPIAASNPEFANAAPRAAADDIQKSPELPTPATTQTQAESISEPGEIERAAVATGQVDFAAKYAGWSLERLEGAKAVLAKANFEKTQEVLAERFKAGLFEELILKEGEDTPPAYGPTRVDGGGEPPGKGLVRYKITKLPWNEYPQLKALNDEVDWLHNRTYELSKPPKR